jgi:type I restriction-modification system DNA methylase subunit
MVSEQNGTVVAIVQMSCAIKNEKELIAVKNRILGKHHLKAVLSMPDDLFYPGGVVTCVMVFEANKQNEGRETWLGYFKNDKFEKRKNQGRIDARGLYKEEKKRWLSAYHNLKEVAGLSVKQEVRGEDEWCTEAYMTTDYALSVACSGTVLSTFYHPYPYYSGRDVYILKPKKIKTEQEMLFYCAAIEQNKYKYNYGRQANTTLKNILLPLIKK